MRVGDLSAVQSENILMLGSVVAFGVIPAIVSRRGFVSGILALGIPLGVAAIAWSTIPGKVDAKTASFVILAMPAISVVFGIARMLRRAVAG